MKYTRLNSGERMDNFAWNEGIIWKAATINWVEEKVWRGQAPAYIAGKLCEVLWYEGDSGQENIYFGYGWNWNFLQETILVRESISMAKQRWKSIFNHLCEGKW